MNTIEKTLDIAAPPARVWAALTDPAAIGEWMDDDGVRVELRAGGRYAFFGGETTGRFVRVEPDSVLEYTWRQAGWPKEWPDSLVHWDLAPAGTGSRLNLVHSNFPNEAERSSHAEGWEEYWFRPMLAWLEQDA